MKKILNNINFVDGFMSRTHAILSIILLMLFMLVPLDSIQIIASHIKSDVLLSIVCIVLCVGVAILLDLDNHTSKARYILGPLGSIMTIFMQSTSSIVWSVYHGKRDMPPPTQHRYLWHAPVVSLAIIAAFYYGIQPGEYTILTNVKNSIELNQLGNFFRENISIIFFSFLAFMSSLSGSAILLDRLNELLKYINIKIPKLVKYLFPTLILVYVFTTTYTNIRIIGICMGLGYLFHIIEDFFTDSGVPLLWPIPIFWKKKVWQKFKFPLSVESGSTVNSIIDVISVPIAIALVIYVFTRG